MKDAGVVFEHGLSKDELSCCEGHFGISFPPDLRALLQAALPVANRGGRDAFPNWREMNDARILEMLNWPFEGIAFDIEHNAYWRPEWGERPPRLGAAVETARRCVASAPRLIPIHSHRYIPEVPREAGNPVFSVYQTDLIYYGFDLWDYLTNEFAPADERWKQAPPSTHRRIEFWSELVDENRPASRSK